MSDIQLPSGPVAFVFPGQGSQFPGMAKDLYSVSPAARSTIDEADTLLGFSLSDLMFNGPAEELEDTFNAQPAILTASIAALRAVEEALASQGKTLHPAVTAGHSLGEFSALVAAGSLDFPTALGIVRERGRLMKQAGAESPGGMAAVLGLDDESIARVCQEASSAGIVVPANRNCPGQIVISGEVAALELAIQLAKAQGAKLVKRLNVSIASHSPLMKDANSAFNQVVASSPLLDPNMPVVGNVTALPLTSEAALRGEIAMQMENPVDWTGSVQTIIARGTTTFLELGPGAVLSGLIKRIDRNVTTISVDQLGLGLPA